MRKIVLASSSLRRQEILATAGLPFEVENSGYDEDQAPPLPPREFVKYLALEKARVVAARHPSAIVIGADTVVVLNNEIFGKPHTEETMREMLYTLSGTHHLIITGIAIIDTQSRKEISRVEETQIKFRALSPQEIDVYVASGEGLEKAGGYALQGGAASFIEKLEGDPLNGVGLPLSALLDELKKFGVEAP
jgi:septum formation protein